MSYKDRELLTDRNGNPIPQVYDPETDNFKPATDSGTVDISNFPETQNVADSNVLAELKTLNENNGISLQAYEKATNAETTANEANTKADETVDRVDTIIAGTTDEAEVIDARLGHPTLRDNLNSVNQQLAHTVKKSETGVLDLNVFDEPTRNVLQGQEPGTINAVLGIGNVKESNLANASVTPTKTDFMKTSSNLINEKTIVLKKIINSAGELVDSVAYSSSDFIEVAPSTDYTSSTTQPGAYYVSQFDKNKTFIKRTGLTGVQTVTLDSATQYVRVSDLTDFFGKGTQINLGSVLLPFEKYYAFVKKEHIDPSSMPGEFELSEKTVSIEHLDFTEPSSNLINEKTVLSNKNINSSGELIDSSLSLSDFIPVTPNTTYTVSTRDTMNAMYVSFWDKDKKYISRMDSTDTETFVTGNNVHFVRVAGFDGFFGNTFQLNLGNKLLPFENYYISLSKEVMPKNVKPHYFAPEEIIGVYKGVGDSYTDLATANDVITAWNTLASEYPEYITETLMGYDASGEYPIYKYRLNPNGLIVDGMGRKLPKMLLVAGIHGGELPPIYSTYSMVRDICENWTEDALLEYLRWNVEFEIIPLANPYSLDHIQGREYGYRHNANGVDLNSNFSENWVSGTPGDATYGGSKPFSEPESQYIKSMIDANTDAIYFGDYHSQGGTDYHLMWIPMSIGKYADENLQIASKYVIEKMSREFVKDYNLIPDRTVLGSTLGGRHNGTTRIYAHAQGIPSANTVEGFNVFPADAGQTYDSVVKANTEFITNWLLAVIKQMKSVY